MGEVSAITFTIPGAPRTKKNSGRIVTAGRGGRHRILPSAAWSGWAERACLDIAMVTRVRRGEFPLLTPVNCCALFYRDANRGDAVGFYQGLADLLQKSGVIADDVQIVSWDGSRLLKDASNPRVQITLTEIPSNDPD